MDYIRKQGIDIESLTECWHACPPQVAIPIVLVDEETQEELPVLNEETGEPTFRIEGGCTCLKLVLPEEEKKEDDVEEKVADVQMQKGKGARSKKQNKKDSKRDRRSRTDRGGKKKSNSPSPSSRRRKRK